MSQQNSKLDSNSPIYDLGRCLLLMMLIGLMDAIALPSYWRQANKAKQSEGKLYVRSIYKAQQAYFVEKGSFSNSVEALGIGIKTETTTNIPLVQPSKQHLIMEFPSKKN